MTDISPTNTPLAPLLNARLEQWEKAVKPQQEKMLDCYNDVMRISRDGDTKGTSIAKARQSKELFIGSTRNKVRATRAKLNDALFGNGKFPFDTSPVNEELRQFSDTMEDIIAEQLERMDAKSMLKDGVDTLATYGTGFIFGPLVRKEKHVETVADNSLGFTSIREEVYPYDAPYYMLGNTLDIIPDPEATCYSDGLGLFWVTWEAAHTVAGWRNDESYSQIEAALIGGSGTSLNDTGSDRAKEMRGTTSGWHREGRIKVARFFGKVPERMLSDPIDGEMEQPEMLSTVADSGTMVDAICVMAGGVLIKANRAPYNDDSEPCLVAQYEKVPHELWGVGVADNNAPNQKVINAAFRLCLETKAMALLGTKSVDRSKFDPREDFKKFPGKVYQFKPGLPPEERNSAIINHIEPDISDGWMSIIQMSEQFSDDDTALTKYTQGDDSRNLNKTATGISMIMNAGSLPSKEVLQNIDTQWIEPMIEGLVKWNLKYLEVETVRKIHGEEKARIWEQIKRFGKSSFMEWQATGTSSFMQKEVLTNKIRAFADFSLSNPATAPLIDARELLQQTWDCMEIGKESPILKEEGEQEIPPQVKQQMDQMKQHTEQMEQALQELGEKYNELDANAQGEAEKRRIDAYKAQTERIKAILPFMPAQAVAQIADELGLDIANDPELVPGTPAVQEQMDMQQALDQPQEMPVQEEAPMPQDIPIDQPASEMEAEQLMPTDGMLPQDEPLQ